MSDLDAETDSRAASNALLALLATGRFRPEAWARFLTAALGRSLHQALDHPRAVTEATALHLLLALLADQGRRRWPVMSWTLVVTHLGMLEDRETLGLPNLLTVARANLPALTDRLGTTAPLAALLTDWLDGHIARATGSVTRFGTQADFLADAVVWNWMTFRTPSPGWVRAISVAAWAAPVTGIAVRSIACGGMRDMPRSRWLRPAAAAEVVLGIYLVVKTLLA